MGTMSGDGGPGSVGPALRLLVVDDDEVDRKSVRRAIARSGLAGAEVREADGAQPALALLAHGDGARRFDCVLLDFELRGATGLDLLRSMREAGDC